MKYTCGDESGDDDKSISQHPLFDEEFSNCAISTQGIKWVNISPAIPLHVSFTGAQKADH